MIDDALEPLPIIGLSALTTPIFLGQDCSATIEALTNRTAENPADAAALLDLGLLHQLYNLQAEGLAFQREALANARHFRVMGHAALDASAARPPADDALRVLMLVQPGTFHDNMPIEFLLETPARPVELELLYLLPDEPLPAAVPAHDLMIVGIGYSSASEALLLRLRDWLADWPRPVLNRPEGVLKTSRKALQVELQDAPGVFVADIESLSRDDLAQIGRGAVEIADRLPAMQFPILVRPIDSHAGNDLAKIDAAAALADYLETAKAERFFITAFVDYRDGEGLFAKSRVVLMEDKPYLAHHAMNDHWMIHYLNAGMLEDASKRDREARAMARFDEDFARRHTAAFKAIHQRLGLDYLVLDCSETPDGRLFVFEADTIMIVHAMDPPAIYPYKKPVMRRIFAAFEELLRRKTCSEIAEKVST
ncbi:MAG: hypothetical protein K2P80_04820 [Beijerinckiaceae bacterium]|nr:hypothetical protein [Beijerinckiaceae bacterium]